MVCIAAVNARCGEHGRWSGVVAATPHGLAGPDSEAPAAPQKLWLPDACQLRQRGARNNRVEHSAPRAAQAAQSQHRPTAAPMTLARSLTASMALLAVGRVASILIALATIAVLTRALGPEEFGYFRTAIAYLSLAMLLGGFGLNTVAVRELSRADADRPRVPRQRARATVAAIDDHYCRGLPARLAPAAG